MAGYVLGTTFCLLLLASLIQGERDDEVIHVKMVEAAVGQNVTLPCILKNRDDPRIVELRWTKQEKENKNKYIDLAISNLNFGNYYFRPNITVQNERNDQNKLTGSSLHLPKVEKWDSGIYVCAIQTFPVGFMRVETQLSIQDKDDIKIKCNVNSTVEVHDGENVTVNCTVFPNTHTQYRWTKDQEQVSESASLELWRVTDANEGVYTLTVNTGNKSLHKDFIIRVLTASTSLTTDLVTVSPQSLTKSVDSSLITSQTTGPSTHVDRTMNSRNEPNTSNIAITIVEIKTSPTNATHINVTKSTATHSDPYHPLHSTPSSYGSTDFKAPQEMVTDDKNNESKPYTLQPEEYTTFGRISQSPTLIVGTSAVVIEDGDTRSHLLVVLIIFLVLILIAVAGFLYRRQVLKERMDLPPPFKPPPPPVKYTTARHSEIYTGPYPIARCNSGAEFMRYETVV